MTNVTPIRAQATAAMIEQLQRVSDNAEREPPGGGDGGGSTLEARIAALETIAQRTDGRLHAIENDLAVVKSNYATREDLYRAIGEQTWKIIGTMVTFGTLLSGIVYFIARNVR